jgi:hypothetical protein
MLRYDGTFTWTFTFSHEGTCITDHNDVQEYIITLVKKIHIDNSTWNILQTIIPLSPSLLSPPFSFPSLLFVVDVKVCTYRCHLTTTAICEPLHLRPLSVYTKHPVNHKPYPTIYANTLAFNNTPRKKTAIFLFCFFVTNTPHRKIFETKFKKDLCFMIVQSV